MVSLKKYRQYMSRVALASGISESMAITIDKEMAKNIQRLPKGEVTLFWLPPGAKSQGSGIDSFREKNSCVIFVMEKYDPQRESAADVLERTQEAAERLKEIMVEDAGSSCSAIRIDVSTLDTLPETEFYGSLAGWSIGFSILTDTFSHE